mmetsp:Transcript_11283/g.27020  ORF Transcript_11283/g.27020 Transcript_11283/m.27020 type:complete len:441 (-) Transcript_11283:855-2177(-)
MATLSNCVALQNFQSILQARNLRVPALLPLLVGLGLGDALGLELLDVLLHGVQLALLAVPIVVVFGHGGLEILDLRLLALLVCDQGRPPLPVFLGLRVVLLLLLGLIVREFSDGFGEIGFHNFQHGDDPAGGSPGLGLGGGRAGLLLHESEGGSGLLHQGAVIVFCRIVVTEYLQSSLNTLQTVVVILEGHVKRLLLLGADGIQLLLSYTDFPLLGNHLAQALLELGDGALGLVQSSCQGLNPPLMIAFLGLAFRHLLVAKRLGVRLFGSFLLEFRDHLANHALDLAEYVTARDTGGPDPRRQLRQTNLLQPLDDLPSLIRGDSSPAVSLDLHEGLRILFSHLGLRVLRLVGLLGRLGNNLHGLGQYLKLLAVLLHFALEFRGFGHAIVLNLLQTVALFLEIFLGHFQVSFSPCQSLLSQRLRRLPLLQLTDLRHHVLIN